MLNFFKKKKIVSVVHLSGIIGNIGGLRSGLTISNVQPLLEKAFKLKKQSAVALIINSPGGSPAQSSLIYKAIKKFKNKKKVKIYSFVEDVAASGGYYIACAGDEIYIDENSILGSIGVIYSGFGFNKLIKRYDIERRIFTTGKNKSFLDSFSKQKLSDTKKIKNIQNEIFKNFRDVVVNSRGNKINKLNKELFSGSFWVGKQAIKLGLADGIGDLKTIMEKKFGEKIKYNLIQPKKTFLKNIFSKSTNRKNIFDQNNMIEEIFFYLESRNIWSRYGF